MKDKPDSAINETETPTDDACWYADGLRFTCQDGCSRCCGGGPGEVYLREEEIFEIADFLGMDVDDFIRRYTRKTDRGSLGLVDKPNYDCAFLTPNGCRIYPVRPIQCRTYPFWPEVLKSPNQWEAEMKYCPGINHPNGKLYSKEEIQAIRDGNDTAKGQPKSPFGK